MRTILIAPGRPSWVEMDVSLLGGFGPVTVIDVLTTRPWLAFTFLPLFWRADLCYFWFGSFRHLPYLLLARMFGKRIIVVAGGYDVNKVESISYGALNRGFLSRTLRKWIFHSAGAVLAVSEYTRRSALEHFHMPAAKVRTVYLAFDPPPAVLLKPWADRSKQVLFLLSARDDMFLVKGVDRIPEICRLLPDVSFQLAGALGERASTYLNEQNPPNLKRVGWVDFQSEAYVKLLNDTRVVCLPSRTESFGAAMVDGAVLGCLPVAFAVGALPEVLTEIGKAVAGDSLADLATAIAQSLNEPDVDVTALRARAMGRFSLERRRRDLSEVLRSLGAI